MRFRSHGMSERILDGLRTRSRHALVDMLTRIIAGENPQSVLLPTQLVTRGTSM